MCQIIYYGFTKNSESTPSGSTCDATTSDTLGAQVAIQTEASDVGKTIVAAIGLRINDIGKGTFYSEEFTPTYSGAIYIFNIPFTGVPTQIGTYTFGYGGLGCGYIYDITNLGSYLCYKCETTKCTVLTVTAPPVCTQPSCTMTIV